MDVNVVCLFLVNLNLKLSIWNGRYKTKKGNLNSQCVLVRLGIVFEYPNLNLFGLHCWITFCRFNSMVFTEWKMSCCELSMLRVEHPHKHIFILKGRDEEKFKISAEKHASNAECVLVQFAVQTEVSVAVYFD